MPIPMLNIAKPQYGPQTARLLYQQATGAAPSAAEAQLRQSGDAALARALGMARSGRGNQALAMRNALDANANMQAQLAGQAAQLRAQEQARAIAQMQAQNAGEQEQINRATGGFMRGVSSALGMAGAGGNAGQVLGAVAPLAMMLSDRRAKTDVGDGGPAATGLLEALSAHTFRYRGDDEQQLGVMAQDLEQAPAGRAIVREGPGGAKMLDSNRALAAALASMGELHERLRRLEGGG